MERDREHLGRVLHRAELPGVAHPAVLCRARPNRSPAPRIVIAEFTGNHSHVVPRRELAPRYRRFLMPAGRAPLQLPVRQNGGPVLVTCWEDRHRCSCRILIV
jgi:hypothetical protein